MYENKYIKELHPGMEFRGIYALRKCELLPYGDTYRMVIDIADSTGHLGGVLWENAEDTYHKLEVNKPVEIKGKIGTYKGSSQITVERIKPAASDSVDPTRFLPSSPNDTEQQIRRLKTIIDGLKNPYLKALLEKIFGEERFMRRYALAPGGKQWHHAYLGGLIDHVLDQCALAEGVAALYHELNRDLLITGVILHDIGKVYELEIGCTIDYSTRGRLLGHIMIGASLVDRAIRSLDEFPMELAYRLEHLILSHHGAEEFGSPILPMTTEAFVLNHLDEIDSKLQAFMHIKDRDTSPDKPWSQYIKLLDRFLYLHPKDDN